MKPYISLSHFGFATLVLASNAAGFAAAKAASGNVGVAVVATIASILLFAASLFGTDFHGAKRQ